MWPHKPEGETKPHIRSWLVLIFLAVAALPVLIVATSISSNRIQPFWLSLQTSQEEPPQGSWIEPVEPYSVTALVLSRKTYNDHNSQFSPVDLALAWGELTDPKLASLLNVSQDNRYYRWFLPPTEKLSPREARIQTSNFHMVANSKELAQGLLAIRRGDLIRLEGQLVNIHYQNQTWRSSLTREDYGTGACEIFLAESIVVLERGLLH
jgi:hypothetical protein